MRTILISLEEAGFPKVVFEGDYVTKREMDIVIKAVKKEHRARIRDYRRQMIIEDYKKGKVENGNGQSSSNSRGTDKDDSAVAE